MDFTKQEIERLQRIENNVGRQIMGAPRYTQVAALRGEIGMSSMKGRIMEGQIKYLQHILRGEGNDLLGRIVEEMRERGKNRWMRGVVENRRIVEIKGDKITNEEIKKKVRMWDTNEWKKEMEEKASLKLYREWREELGGQDDVYDNREASMIMFKCRTNNLNLGARKRFTNQSTECIMCGNTMEDLQHYILHCPAYREERAKTTILQQPYQEDENTVIGELLFNRTKIEESKTLLHKFWKIRTKKVKELENS